MILLFAFAACDGYFCDTACMATAFEFSRQEYIYNFKSHFRRNEAGWQYENIGVVVGTGKTRKFGRPAQSGADTLMLVESYTDTVATAAYGDPGVIFTFFDSDGARVGVIGVITTFGAMCTEVPT